jgi:hypothetical protein
VSQDGRGEAPHDPSEAVGTLGEEAAKLLGAVSDWARDHGSELGQGVVGLAAHAARSAHEMSEHLATGDAECTYCPICRTAHALRESSPEVRAHVTAAATSLLQAASGLLAAVVPDPSPDPAARVERIDLDDGTGDWPDHDPEEGDQ